MERCRSRAILPIRLPTRCKLWLPSAIFKERWIICATRLRMDQSLRLSSRWEGLQFIFATWSSRRQQRSEEHTSELQSPCNLVCRLLLEKKKKEANSDVVDTAHRR